MGYLTTVTIYNDGLSLLKQYPTEFCGKLYEASGGMEATDFGLGYFCNFANVQRTRHADDHTMYVHMGNCVTEVNACDPKFKELIERHPDFADALIGHVERELKALKKLQRAQAVLRVQK
jgi:hypothetical protein